MAQHGTAQHSTAQHGTAHRASVQGTGGLLQFGNVRAQLCWCAGAWVILNCFAAVMIHVLLLFRNSMMLGMATSSNSDSACSVSTSGLCMG
jgi:hypothetical protein